LCDLFVLFVFFDNIVLLVNLVFSKVLFDNFLDLIFLETVFLESVFLEIILLLLFIILNIRFFIYILRHIFLNKKKLKYNK